MWVDNGMLRYPAIYIMKAIDAMPGIVSGAAKLLRTIAIIIIGDFV